MYIGATDTLLRVGPSFRAAIRGASLDKCHDLLIYFYPPTTLTSVLSNIDLGPVLPVGRVQLRTIFASVKALTTTLSFNHQVLCRR